MRMSPVSPRCAGLCKTNLIALSLWAVAVALTLGGMATSARAQGQREAEMEYQRGLLLFEMKNHAQASESILKAWNIVPENRYLPALALSFAGVGDAEKALVFGEIYLERQVETPDEDVVKLVSDLREGFAKGKGRLTLDVAPLGGKLVLVTGSGTAQEARVDVGPVIRYLPVGDWKIAYAKEGFVATDLTLTVSAEPQVVRVDLARMTGKSEVRIQGNVAGAKVRMDGQEVGTVPFKARVESGDHLFQVWAPDHVEWTGVVDAVPGKVIEVTANLVRAQGRVVDFPRYDLAVEGDGGVSLSLFGWITMGLGVAAGGAAGYFFYDMYATNDQLVALPNGDPQITVLDQKVQDDWLYAVISSGAAGALVAGGLLMVLLDGDDQDEPAGMELLAVQPWTVPGGGGFNAAWVF